MPKKQPPQILQLFKKQALGGVQQGMFTLFRVMSGAQSDAEAAALDSIMDGHSYLQICLLATMRWSEKPLRSLPSTSH